MVNFNVEYFMNYRKVKIILPLISICMLLIQGCAGVNTFPTVARAGDTVSVMVGGTENSRKETIAVTLTDADNVQWDLQALGKVRSVFNLRADARAKGTHYSSYLESVSSWIKGHEPVQTVLVVDIPVEVAPGVASLNVNTGVDDDSSGIAHPYVINVEIIPGLGSGDNFLRKDFLAPNAAVDFSRLEPAPHAKVNFGVDDGVVIGAASLTVDFDETVVNPNDINVYVPESSVRGLLNNPGAFGETQRMVYWHQDGQQLFVDIIAPQGIKKNFLKLYIVHPDDVVGSPGFNIINSVFYDTSGSELILTPDLVYFQ